MKSLSRSTSRNHLATAALVVGWSVETRPEFTVTSGHVTLNSFVQSGFFGSQTLDYPKDQDADDHRVPIYSLQAPRTESS
jgi:hypothetical protein